MTMPTPNAGARITAAQLATLLPVRAFKPADTVAVSTTSIVADPDLSIPIVANAEYDVRLHIVYQQGTTGQLVNGFTGPAGATFEWVAYGLTTTVTASDIGSISVQQRGLTDLKTIGGTNAVSVVCDIDGRLVTLGTAGSLVYRWGPSASSVTGTVVKAGSFMVARRIA